MTSSSPFATYAPARRGVPAAVRVRPPTLKDVDAVAAIWAEREGGEAKQAVPMIAREIERIQDGSPDRYLCVAEIEGQIVGYGRCGVRAPAERLPGGWYLLGVVVTPASRRRGAGRALTAHRLAWLAEKGVEEVFYFTAVVNRASTALHEAYGFEEIDRGFFSPPPHAWEVSLLRARL